MIEKQNIGGLFDRIAARYDAFNHLTSLGIDRCWRRRAVKGMRRADKVLDVAVGTADLTIEMLRRDKAHTVEGIDLSTGMMRIGEEKVRKAGFAQRVRFTEGSALELPYPDASFDCVTCAYGIRNFSDLDKGLSEFQRVLRPGGQLLILEFSYPQNRLIAALYTFYFKYVMTAVGSLLTKGDRKSFDYFYHSVKNFIWGREMLSHLAGAGFTDAAFRTLTFGISTIYTATKQ